MNLVNQRKSKLTSKQVGEWKEERGEERERREGDGEEGKEFPLVMYVLQPGPSNSSYNGLTH